MPTLRPFRALRFDAASTDLSAVLAPPYDIISPAQRIALLERDPHNAVRIDLPADVGSGDDAAYLGAARAVAEWRSASVLVKDRLPTVTVHEMRWTDVAGGSHACLGFLARLRLEAFGPGGGVLPHERTMSGPKEDRFRLLKATGLNTSPIVFLAGSDPKATADALTALTLRDPDMLATTADGVSHRVWVVPTSDPGRPGDEPRPAEGLAADGAGSLLAMAASAPLTIADGHHRYETALRYRAERGARRACESDPPWDYVLALVYPLHTAPPALPTHRVIRGEPSGEELLGRLAAWGDIERLADREALLAEMSRPVELAAGATGSGRIGLYSDGRAALLRVDLQVLDGLLDAGLSEASRGLDVNALGAILGSLHGEAADDMADAGRLWYVKDAGSAVGQVDDGEASACFLLDPMPADAITRVAEAGEVMPHKSTYFSPKAPTGLLFSPLEW